MSRHGRYPGQELAAIEAEPRQVSTVAADDDGPAGAARHISAAVEVRGLRSRFATVIRNGLDAYDDFAYQLVL